MKHFITLILVFAASFATRSQEVSISRDTVGLPPHSFRAIASVQSAENDYMVIVIENVVSYGRGVTATPMQGDELTVRLPGRRSPSVDARIEVDLQESIELGALPTSYIMLDYSTIN